MHFSPLAARQTIFQTAEINTHQVMLKPSNHRWQEEPEDLSVPTTLYRAQRLCPHWWAQGCLSTTSPASSTSGLKIITLKILKSLLITDRSLQYLINLFNFKCNAPIWCPYKGIRSEWKIWSFIENDANPRAGQSQDNQTIQVWGKNNLLTLSLYYFSAKMIWTPANKNSPAFTALSPPITVKARQANGRRKMLKVHHNETGK